jgi:hypothetical protein
VDGVEYHVAERATGTPGEQRVLLDASLGRGADLAYESLTTLEGLAAQSYRELALGAPVNVTDAGKTTSAGSGKLSAAMSNSLLRLADGANTVEVTGTVTSGVILGGSGNDSLTVGGVARTSFIDLGGGDNSLTLSGSTPTNCIILAGTGNDAVKLGTINLSTINLGNGDNTVENSALRGSALILGDGDDRVTLAEMSGNSLQSCGSQVELGNGTNSLTVSGSVNAHNGTSTDISGGSGADAVTLAGTVGTSTYIAGAVNLDLGAGNDSLTVGQSDKSLIVGSAYFSYNSVTGLAERQISAGCAMNAELGSGNNVFVMHGLNETTYGQNLELTVGGNLANGSDLTFGEGDGLFILHDSTVSGTVGVNMLAGDDAAELRDVTLAADADFALDLGDGNDSLTLNNVSVTAGGAGVLKGGDGSDALRLEGGDFSLGGTDELSFEGFESIDLTDGAAHTLTVTAAALENNGEVLTQAITLESATVASGSHVMRVTGDSGDTLTLSGATNVQSKGAYAEAGLSYNVYSYEHNMETRYVIASQGMNVAAA